MKVYSLLQNSKKSFVNKTNVRNLKRKLEIRRKKRSQGFNVQPLEKHELKKANISLSDTSIHPQSKKTTTRKEKKKHDKDKEGTSSNDGENLQGRLLPEDASSRVLDRFQVSLAKSFIQAFGARNHMTLFLTYRGNYSLRLIQIIISDCDVSRSASTHERM